MREDRVYRSARSGREWSKAQLKDYNIVIDNVDAVTFFGQEIKEVALEEVPESVLVCLTSSDVVDDEDPGFDFLRFHDIVISGRQESTVDSLAQEILRIMKFRGSRRIILFHQRIPLTMSGADTIAETDVCVQNNDNILLLIQKDKAYGNRSDAEPQVTAEAIAAFQYNNEIRRRMMKKEELQYERTLNGCAALLLFKNNTNCKHCSECKLGRICLGASLCFLKMHRFGYG
jgi:hypothetical protein